MDQFSDSWYCYQFRYCSVNNLGYITNLLYAGVDPKTVQYLAGHENSKTTMDIYAKVKYNKPEELFDVVNQALHPSGTADNAAG